MAEPQRTYVTQEFLEKMKEELTQLKTKKRAEVAQRLKEAIAMGDLSETPNMMTLRMSSPSLKAESLSLNHRFVLR